MSLLAKIIAHSARRVEKLRRERPVDELRADALYARAPRGLNALLARKGPRRVAEVRFASPECGMRVPRGFDTAEESVRWATAAVEKGAHAVSVVAERHYHAGSWDHVSAVRTALSDVCLIARDILLDEYQLELARAHGADAVTLWPEVTGSRTLALADAARKLKLGVVMEVFNAAQLELAFAARADAALALARDLDSATAVPTARALFATPIRRPLFFEAVTPEDLDASPIPDVWAAADLC